MATQKSSKIYTLLTAFTLIILFTTLAKAELSVTKKVLTNIPESVVEGTVTISDDGQAYAFVVKSQEGQRIVLNGKQQIPFSRISKPIFSPISNKFFYWALDKSSGKQEIVLVADGKQISSGLNNEGSLWFSRDGKRWAAVGGKQKGVVIFIDGKQIDKYSDASYPTFSRNGKHLAFLVPGGLIVDEVQIKEFKDPEVDVSFEVGAYVIGPNMPPLHKIRYLSDGSLLFITKDLKGWTVFKDDKRLASYRQNIWGGGSLRIMNFSGFEDAASILPSSINIADAAPYAIWWEKQEGKNMKWRVVRNGLPVDKIVSDSYWDSQKPVLSANGKRWGYPAYIDATKTDKEDLFAIFDGKKYGPYSHLWGITFSKNNKRFAYAASDGSDEQPWSYYIDGKKLNSKYDSVWPPQLSNDGRRFAWKAKRADKMVVAVDDRDVYVGKKPLKGPIIDNNRHVHWYIIEDNKLVQYTAK